MLEESRMKNKKMTYKGESNCIKWEEESKVEKVGYKQQVNRMEKKKVDYTNKKKSKDNCMGRETEMEIEREEIKIKEKVIICDMKWKENLIEKRIN